MRDIGISSSSRRSSSSSPSKNVSSRRKSSSHQQQVSSSTTSGGGEGGRRMSKLTDIDYHHHHHHMNNMVINNDLDVLKMDHMNDNDHHHNYDNMNDNNDNYYQQQMNSMKILHNSKIQILMKSINTMKNEMMVMKAKGKDHRRSSMIQNMRIKMREQHLVTDFLKEEIIQITGWDMEDVNDKIIKKTISGPKRFRPKTREEIMNDFSDLKKKYNRSLEMIKKLKLKMSQSQSQSQATLAPVQVGGDGGNGGGGGSIRRGSLHSGGGGGGLDTNRSTTSVNTNQMQDMSILVEEIEALKIQLQARTNNMSSVMLQCEKMRSEVKDFRLLEDSLVTKEKRYHILQKNNMNLEENHAMLLDRFEHLQENYNGLKITYQVALSDNAEKLNNMKQNLSHVTEQLMKLTESEQTLKEELNKEVHDGQIRRLSTEKIIMEKEATLSEHVNQLEATKQRNQQLDENYQASRDELSQMMEKLTDKSNQEVTLQSQVKALHEKSNELQKNYEKVCKEYEKKIQEGAKQYESEKKNIQEIELQKQITLEELYANVKNENNRLLDDHESLKRTVNTLDKQIIEKSSKCDDVMNQNKKLKRKYEEALNYLERISTDLDQDRKDLKTQINNEIIDQRQNLDEFQTKASTSNDNGELQSVINSLRIEIANHNDEKKEYQSELKELKKQLKTELLYRRNNLPSSFDTNNNNNNSDETLNILDEMKEKLNTSEIRRQSLERKYEKKLMEFEKLQNAVLDKENILDKKVVMRLREDIKVLDDELEKYRDMNGRLKFHCSILEGRLKEKGFEPPSMAGADDSIFLSSRAPSMTSSVYEELTPTNSVLRMERNRPSSSSQSKLQRPPSKSNSNRKDSEHQFDPLLMSGPSSVNDDISMDRGFTPDVAEKNNEEEDEKAAKIQALYRGKQARKSMAVLKKEQEEEEEEDNEVLFFDGGARLGGDESLPTMDVKNENEEEDEKAAKIQALYRGKQARKSIAVIKKEQEEEEDEKAAKIQALYRGKQARKSMAVIKKVREEEDEEEEEDNEVLFFDGGARLGGDESLPMMEVKNENEEEDEKAAKIQALYRGKQARKSMAQTKENLVQEKELFSLSDESESEHSTALDKRVAKSSMVSKNDEDQQAAKIQALYRGKKTRQSIINLKSDEPEPIEKGSENESNEALEEAASKVQALVRGNLARKTLNGEDKNDKKIDTAVQDDINQAINEAAAKVQALYRGSATRNSLLAKNNSNEITKIVEDREVQEKIDTVMNDAAAKVQALYRGNTIRKSIVIKKTSEASEDIVKELNPDISKTTLDSNLLDSTVTQDMSKDNSAGSFGLISDESESNVLQAVKKKNENNTKSENIFSDGQISDLLGICQAVDDEEKGMIDRYMMTEFMIEVADKNKEEMYEKLIEIWMKDHMEENEKIKYIDFIDTLPELYKSYQKFSDLVDEEENKDKQEDEEFNAAVKIQSQIRGKIAKQNTVKKIEDEENLMIQGAMSFNSDDDDSASNKSASSDEESNVIEHSNIVQDDDDDNLMTSLSPRSNSDNDSDDDEMLKNLANPSSDSGNSSDNDREIF